jgi:hypothetical protein
MASCRRDSFVRSSKPSSPGAATTRCGSFPAINDRRSRPLDYCVAQVHLRQFYFSALDGKQMYGFRKQDARIFPWRSKDVRRIENGGANADLANDRASAEPYAPPHLRQPSPRRRAAGPRSGGRRDQRQRRKVGSIAPDIAGVLFCVERSHPDAAFRDVPRRGGSRRHSQP